MDETRYLTNDRLADLCKQQNAVFKKDKAASDGRYCYELIRRAVFRIDDADKLFYEIYKPWLEKKIYFLCKEKEIVADLAQESFLRFFRYVTTDTWLQFPSLPHLLGYLSKCSQASVLNYYRKTSKRQETEEPLNTEQLHSITTTKRPIESSFDQQQLQQNIWDCVKRNCKDPEDHLLAEQLWLYGKKPDDLAHRFSEKFPHISDIYKRKRNLLDRIKRDTQCQNLLN